MSEMHAYEIPPTLLRNIKQLPEEYPVALLLRHSIREEFGAGDIGNDFPITEDGKNIAFELGRFLSGRLRSLHSSPLLRCVQTAQALREGGGYHLDISEHRFLGDPGVFVLDGALAWSNWEAIGNEGVMRHLASENYALPGMADPERAAQELLRYMLLVMDGSPGVHVFVTHDTILGPVVARLLKQTHEVAKGPLFLEGALFWRSHVGVNVAYRDESLTVL